MNEQRLIQLEGYIVEHQDVTLKELQYEFHVSMNTLRSDLKQLEDAGVIQKKYGGVRYQTRTPFKQRLQRDSLNKREIAKAAAMEINNNDVVFIDFGTTTAYIVDYIDPLKHVTVITPNMHIIEKSLVLPNIRLLVCAGEFSEYNYGLLPDGPRTSFSDYKMDKAFISCDAISDSGQVQCTRVATENIKTVEIGNAKKKYLLCCSDKFHLKAPIKFATLSDFDMVFTDKLLREENENLLKSAGASYSKV